ncbi:MAG: flavin reductase domain-containing protein [Microbacterium sp. 71-36]|uniref:flavin reductase family protein n=1 Tax=unclassified Microbacterium TaxID=2609290 RepID=UPI00086849B0|nr:MULTISPECIES: flavin reductase family protein [unclassified Microbacterium]MBN9210924.1 flavin reductase family protein [Microbacterium sp.]ODT38843.1 MAG: flavin reductase domain-containing protein [Microbacterium sp. SCN 71-17]OJV77191.1 MAG: flavin reductase domain-containing protein [Microbacterium sp. 71-36]
MHDVEDFDALTPYERYKLMASLIVPRPIAWVTTLGPDGVPNAAPFSMFAMVGEDPPLVMVSIDRLPGGARKDTAVNIDATGEFVVHLVDRPLVEAMDATSVRHPPEIDELAHRAIVTVPAASVRPPVIAEAPVALECVLFSRMDIPSREIYFGRVQRLRTRPGLVDRARMRVRLTDYAPVARFGASFYTTTRERFTLTGDPTTDIDSL